MPNSITFNGTNSLTCGLYVSGGGTYNAPSRDYEKVSIPGRNGDLLFSKHRFNAIDVIYNAIVIDNYSLNTEKVRNWLLSTEGYCRLEDTYHPDEYRQAMFEGPIDFETSLLEAGSTDLTFHCRPERWLKSGEDPITMISSTVRSIKNPTMFNAKPLIRVYGYGAFTVGSGLITINTAGVSYLDIDCATLNCYEELSTGAVANRNDRITVSSWPELAPGQNGVNIASSITKIIITPRWWII